MSAIQSFIIIDDDPFNNIICSLIIKKTLGEVDTKTFSIPEEGLNYLMKEFRHNLRPTVLFLDINMPMLTSWEFMDHYEEFNDAIKTQITVYIISSSVDQLDKEKANANKYIKGFLSKPLNRDVILSASSSV